MPFFCVCLMGQLTFLIFTVLSFTVDAGDGLWCAEPREIVLSGIESPSCLRFCNEQIFLTADVLEAKPGLFSVTDRSAETWQVHLDMALPLWDIQGLADCPVDTALLVSAKRYTADPNQWHAEILTVAPAHKQILDRGLLDLECTCRDQRPDCGMTAAIEIDDATLLALKAANPAALVSYHRQGSMYTRIGYRTITVNQVSCSVSDMRVYQDQLLVLVKDKWLVAAAPLSAAIDSSWEKLTLKPTFDFSHLKQAYRVESFELYTRGMAQSMDIDESGRLWLLLNNRGYPFKRYRHSAQASDPRILVFEPQSQIPQIQGPKP